MSGETNGCASFTRPGRARGHSVTRPAPEFRLEALFVSTGVVALAEIGDKTQLLTLVLAARYKRPWPIVFGIFVATLVNHFIAGAVGAWLGHSLDDDALRWVLGVSFLAMAAWMLVPDKLEDGAGKAAASAVSS